MKLQSSDILVSGRIWPIHILRCYCELLRFAIITRFYAVLFALMQKDAKKSRQSPIAPRVFALPTPPHV